MPTQARLDAAFNFVNNSSVESENTNDNHTYSHTHDQGQLGQLRDNADDHFRFLLEACYPDTQGQGIPNTMRNGNIQPTVAAGNFNNSSVVTNDTHTYRVNKNSATSRSIAAMAHISMHPSFVDQRVVRQLLTVIPSFLFKLSTPTASTVYKEIDISTVREAWGIVQRLGAPNKF